MQLLYIYIGGYIEVTEKDFIDVTDEPFRKLKNIELNFSNKFIFHLDENNKLDVKKNEEYIDHYFASKGYANLSNRKLCNSLFGFYGLHRDNNKLK
jgi:hypothetical protein